MIIIMKRYQISEFATAPLHKHPIDPRKRNVVTNACKCVRAWCVCGCGCAWGNNEGRFLTLEKIYAKNCKLKVIIMERKNRTRFFLNSDK